MENYYKSISSTEFYKTNDKDNFDLQDVKQVSKYIPSPLEKEFDTPLKPIEKRDVSRLVCKNIYTIMQVYNAVIQNDGKYDHLITKLYLKMCKNEVGNDESKLIPLKAAYILANGTGNSYVFQGKIPKKGFFSNRQSIANTWIDDFIKHFGWNVISQVLDKTGNNKELAFIATAEFIACFLVNTYPDEFASSSTVRDIIVGLSKM